MSSRAPIPYGRQQITEEDILAVTSCLTSAFLTQGPRVAEFESALAAMTGARYVVALANGTAALHLAYLALGLGPGDVGITTPISFVATANGLLYAGSRVAFADVEAANGLILPIAVQSVVDELASEGVRPKVITPVDLAGQPTDRKQIQAIAKECGAFILEDAAHSLGATYDVDGVTYRVGGCAHADAAIMSFHPVKHVTTGEGGAVLTNDKVIYQKLLSLRTHGIHKDPARFKRSTEDPFVGPWYYEQTELGFNYRITDFQCALGTSQLRRLDAFVERRQQIAARYDAALASGTLAEHLVPARRLPDRTHAHHLYVVQLRARSGEDLKQRALRRRTLYERLSEERIHCQVHYIPIPWQPYYQGNALVRGGAWPGAEEYYASSISIPMFPAMTDLEVDVVIEALERACTS